MGSQDPSRILLLASTIAAVILIVATRGRLGYRPAPPALATPAR
jgi:hypothetical protein